MRALRVLAILTKRQMTDNAAYLMPNSFVALPRDRETCHYCGRAWQGPALFSPRVAYCEGIRVQRREEDPVDGNDPKRGRDTGLALRSY